MSSRISPQTLAGVEGADISTHTFRTADGLELSLLRFCREPTGDAVLLVHGLTTSSDMFIMPEHENLVSYLLDHGFTDVWTLDGRMSNRHAFNRMPHRFTLDDVALYDYPAALKTMRDEIGDRGLHVITHCLGSLTFLMGLAGGAVDGVTSVIANSTALTPHVPLWSKVKLTVAPTLLERVLRLPYVDPHWRQAPLLSRRGSLARAVGLLHPECDVHTCHMLSMMWGSGRPALYNHANLHELTHERGGDLYGPTGFQYYRHVRKMVGAGRAVKSDPDDPRYRSLPDDYLSAAVDIEPPVLLTTGADNRVFTDSNIACYQHLEEASPGTHELEVFGGYGHQDVFMGRDCARDVFPRMLDFLKRQGQ